MQIKLTKLQAYNVMLCYLEEIYEKEKSEYLGDILSNSEFWSDKITADRGSWSDWQKALRITAIQDTKLRNNNKLTSSQACKAMFNYIDNYVSHYDPKPDYLIKLLESLQLLTKKNNALWQDWLRIANEVVKKEDPRVIFRVCFLIMKKLIEFQLFLIKVSTL